jgi:hypothetical protein
MHASDTQDLIEKLRALPLERQAEVEDFIDFLRYRSQTTSTTVKRQLASFPVISVGRWPPDMPTSRDQLYGDDGR